MGQALSETEAHTKWCSEAQVTSIVTAVGGGTEVVAVPVNRVPERRDPFEGAHCIGSDCMHWTWMPGQKGKLGYCGKSEKPPS